MRTDYTEAIRAEQEAHSSVKRLAAELAIACRPIAHQGDGNCGAVIDYVIEALSAQVLYSVMGARPKAQPKKQVINQGLRTQVFERDAYRCLHCGTHINLTVDHIKPESKGGTLDFDNLQTLCAPCNSSKGAKE